MYCIVLAYVGLLFPNCLKAWVKITVLQLHLQHSMNKDDNISKCYSQKSVGLMNIDTYIVTLNNNINQKFDKDQNTKYLDLII